MGHALSRGVGKADLSPPSPNDAQMRSKAVRASCSLAVHSGLSRGRKAWRQLRQRLTAPSKPLQKVWREASTKLRPHEDAPPSLLDNAQPERWQPSLTQLDKALGTLKTGKAWVWAAGLQKRRATARLPHMKRHLRTWLARPHMWVGGPPRHPRTSTTASAWPIRRVSSK